MIFFSSTKVEINMRRLVSWSILVALIVTILSACGTNSNSINNGWLAHGQYGVYFLDLSNGSPGIVDYASDIVGQGLQKSYGTVVVHNDNTLEVGGIYNGELRDCTSCSYSLSNGQMMVSYTDTSFVTGPPISGTMTFSVASPSDYDTAVKALQPVAG